MLGRMRHPGDLDNARPGQPPGPADQVDALAVQPADLRVVRVVRDVGVAPGQRLPDVDLSGGRRFAGVRRRRAGPQQRLGRNARPVGALTACQLSLDDRDP
jgi:hypothetical protein